MGVDVPIPTLPLFNIVILSSAVFDPLFPPAAVQKLIFAEKLLSKLFIIFAGPPGREAYG